jgi:cytochrome b561
VPARYTRVAILLHWLTATLILANLVIVWTVDSLPETWSRPAVDMHKSIGLTVFGLVVMRILWRTAHRPPPLPDAYKPWERRASHVTHIALYALIFLLPLTGYIHDSAFKLAAKYPLRLYGLVPFGRIGFIANLDPATKEYVHSLFFSIHMALAYVLYALVALHVLAALKHQWIDGHQEIERILPAPPAP